VSARTPKVIVYGPARAPFNVKVTLALRAKGLAYEEIEPSGPEDYRRWNPETGLLPVMDYDGTRVPDSSRILDWLDQQHPEPPLLARDPRIARAQRALEAWTGETFFYYWLRWLRTAFDRTEAGADATGSGQMARLGILMRVREAIAERPRSLPGFGADFERRLDDVCGFLGDRPFFYAERPSRADLTMVAFLGSLEGGEVPGGPRMLEKRPRLVELMRRVRGEIGL
jgi:glutathione S-transferase